jgi:hypothetical protein
MTAFDHEELGALIAALRPVPAGWVRAAQELPAARLAIEGIVSRAVADAAYRARVVADLESALAEEGVEPSSVLLAELRERFLSG